MTKKLLMVCVVGLMAAPPAVCPAVTIDAALETANDAQYVQMGQASWIALRLGGTCTNDMTNDAMRLNFSQDSGGIWIDFYSSNNSDDLASWTPKGSFNGMDPKNKGSYAVVVYSSAFDFDAVVITAYQYIPDPPEPPEPPEPSRPYVYLDAVQGVLKDGGGTTGGRCVGSGGAVTPDTDDPVVMIQDLIAEVLVINASNGIVNSLDVKLEAALNALDDANLNNNGAAVNSLEAFQNFCEVQRDKQLREVDVDRLIGRAETIIGLLTAP